MSRLESIAWIEIIGGLILVIAFPLLLRIRLFLPLPKTPFGRGAGIIAEEAFACGLIMTGIIGLIGRTPLSDLFYGARTILFVVFVMAVIGVCLQRL